MLSLTKYLQSGQTTISNLLFVNYRKMGLESEEFLFVLQLHMKQQEGDSFPDLQLIAINMGLKSDQVYQILNRLVSGGFIAIETITVDGKKADQYNLLPLYERLEKYLDSQASKAKENQQEQELSLIHI